MKWLRNIIAFAAVGGILFLASCAKEDNNNSTAGDDRDKRPSQADAERGGVRSRDDFSELRCEMTSSKASAGHLLIPLLFLCSLHRRPYWSRRRIIRTAEFSIGWQILVFKGLLIANF